MLCRYFGHLGQVGCKVQGSQVGSINLSKDPWSFEGMLSGQYEYIKPIWGFPKIRGTILGVPTIRTVVFWGLYWGSLILGNYHILSGKGPPWFQPKP